MKKKEFICLDSYEIDKLIEDFYGHQFKSMADGEEYECYQVYLVEKEKEVFWQEDIDKFIKTGKYSMLISPLLTDMCNKGHIEAGNYLIGFY